MLLLFLLINFNLYTCAEGIITLIKGRQFCGYIFPKEYDLFGRFPRQTERFTPLKSDVEKAEVIIRTQLTALNNPRVNQVDGCPVIDQKLRKYKRQYVGFINADRDKVLWVNFVWNRNLDPRFKDQVISVQDGCSYYWNVKVNLSKQELYDLQINGMS